MKNNRFLQFKKLASKKQSCSDYYTSCNSRPYGNCGNIVIFEKIRYIVLSFTKTHESIICQFQDYQSRIEKLFTMYYINQIIHRQKQLMDEK